MGSQIQNDVKNLVEEIEKLKKRQYINRIDTVLPTDETKLQELLDSVVEDGFMVALNSNNNLTIYQKVLGEDGKYSFKEISVSASKTNWDTFIDSLPTDEASFDVLLEGIPQGGIVVVDKDSDYSAYADRIDTSLMGSSKTNIPTNIVLDHMPDEETINNIPDGTFVTVKTTSTDSSTSSS